MSVKVRTGTNIYKLSERNTHQGLKNKGDTSAS